MKSNELLLRYVQELAYYAACGGAEEEWLTPRETALLSAISKEWRRIETAPADGRSVMLANSSFVTEGYRRFDGDHVSILNESPRTPYTHWMPLPTPPARLQVEVSDVP